MTNPICRSSSTRRWPEAGHGTVGLVLPTAWPPSRYPHCTTLQYCTTLHLAAPQRGRSVEVTWQPPHRPEGNLTKYMVTVLQVTNTTFIINKYDFQINKYHFHI